MALCVLDGMEVKIRNKVSCAVKTYELMMSGHTGNQDYAVECRLKE